MQGEGGEGRIRYGMRGGSEDKRRGRWHAVTLIKGGRGGEKQTAVKSALSQGADIDWGGVGISAAWQEADSRTERDQSCTVNPKEAAHLAQGISLFSFRINNRKGNSVYMNTSI